MPFSSHLAERAAERVCRPIQAAQHGDAPAFFSHLAFFHLIR
jgi:hypothetical protein